MRVRYAPLDVLSEALQITRNLYQYFGASCELAEYSKSVEGSGNVISVLQGLPSVVLKSSRWEADSHPIAITDHCVEISRNDGSSSALKHYPLEPGLGAIFLVPRPNEAVELRVWGRDSEGLGHALRLVPSLTGVGQPDFVLLRRECAWKGSAGVLAMGFFDSQWQVSRGSYLS